jgi:sugar lactone lactonase YvrE
MARSAARGYDTGFRSVLSRRGFVRLASRSVLAGAVVGCGAGAASPGGSPRDGQPAAPSANQQTVEAAQPGQFRVLATLTGSGPGDPFKTPNGVAVDAEDNLYVADTHGKRVCKFDRDLKFLLAWGAEGSEVALEAPVDVAVAPGGQVWVLDRANGSVLAFTRDGKLISRFVGQGFYSPFGLAAADDAVYVADTGTGRVLRFSTGGELQVQLTKRDTGEVAAKEPTGLALEPDGTVVAIDGALSRLLRLSPEGKLLGSFDAVAQGVARLVRLADGSYLVSDTNRGRLLRWDRDGKLIAKYGRHGEEEGQFRVPTGLAVSKQGHVYVADSQSNRVQKLALE